MHPLTHSFAPVLLEHPFSYTFFSFPSFNVTYSSFSFLSLFIFSLLSCTLYFVLFLYSFFHSFNLLSSPSLLHSFIYFLINVSSSSFLFFPLYFFSFLLLFFISLYITSLSSLFLFLYVLLASLLHPFFICFHISSPLLFSSISLCLFSHLLLLPFFSHPS